MAEALNTNYLHSISTDALSSIDPFTPSSWQANWLLSKFENNIWVLKTADSVQLQSGEWTQTIRIYFTDTLPNQHKLSAPQYKAIRETIKKILFLSRQGYYLGVEAKGSETTRSQQLISICNSLKMLIKWMINRDHQPELTGFLSLTQNDIYEFSRDCLGGSQQADGTISLIRTFLNQQKSEGNLEGFLKNGRLDTSKIANSLNLKNNRGSTFSLSLIAQAALNEFENKPLPDWVFNTRSLKAEFLATSAIKITEHIEKPPSRSLLSNYLKGFKALGYFSALLPELHGMDWAAQYSVDAIGNKLGFSEKGKTKTIPIQTALEYLDHAIYWILIIAPELIALKQDCDNQLLTILSKNKSRKDQVTSRVSVDINQRLTHALADRGLTINRYNQNPTKATYAEVRENLSVEETAECLVSAAYIIIGTFSCKRVSEVLSLTRNCIRPAMDGGSELVFGLRKASPSEALSLVGRPVPDIVRKAVDVLIELRPTNVTPRTSNLDHDPIFLSSFFTKREESTSNQMSEDTLYRRLEKFADIVQITPKNNRRWYLKTHELRRFFAITYFWHDKFTNLSALSWYMGHTDTEMTMRYITEIIAGQELPEEEARLIASVMKEDNKSSIEHMGKLTAQVCKHFNTTNLSIIDRNHLEGYLEERFKCGASIHKHGLGAEVIYMEETESE